MYWQDIHILIKEIGYTDNNTKILIEYNTIQLGMAALKSITHFRNPLQKNIGKWWNNNRNIIFMQIQWACALWKIRWVHHNNWTSHILLWIFMWIRSMYDPNQYASNGVECRRCSILKDFSSRPDGIHIHFCFIYLLLRILKVSDRLQYGHTKHTYCSIYFYIYM